MLNINIAPSSYSSNASNTSGVDGRSSATSGGRSGRGDSLGVDLARLLDNHRAHGQTADMSRHHDEEGKTKLCCLPELGRGQRSTGL